jgi:hypothetical protein
MTPAAHASCVSAFPHARQQVDVYRIVRYLRWAAMERGQPATPEGLLGAAGIKCTINRADLDASIDQRLKRNQQRRADAGVSPQ